MVPVGILAAQGVVGRCGNVLEVGIADAIRLCRIFDSLNVVPVGVLGAQEGVPGAEGDVGRCGGLSLSHRCRGRRRGIKKMCWTSKEAPTGCLFGLVVLCMMGVRPGSGVDVAYGQGRRLHPSLPPHFRPKHRG